MAEITPPHGVSIPLEITLLGTGTSQGIPVIGCKCQVCRSPDKKNHRLRTAAFIKAGHIGLAIDIGPDFRRQMLDNQLQDVHAVLLTHEHNDHISGLDDIRPINFLYHRDIPIYGHQRTIDQMHKRFYYAFDPSNDYPGKPRVHSQVIDHTPFMIGDAMINPILIDHGVMDIFGFRIDRLAYITDAKTIPSQSKKELLDLDVLILNALRYETHATHLNVAEAIELCHELKPKRCFLTHISHEMGLHEEVNASLPESIQLGYDGLTLKIN
jgi:phosphoribosyl 1,2-cyclic phosphate phosphodiesterase